jgi:hypothetical protein
MMVDMMRFAIPLNSEWLRDAKNGRGDLVPGFNKRLAHLVEERLKSDWNSLQKYHLEERVGDLFRDVCRKMGAIEVRNSYPPEWCYLCGPKGTWSDAVAHGYLPAKFGRTLAFLVLSVFSQDLEAFMAYDSLNKGSKKPHLRSQIYCGMGVEAFKDDFKFSPREPGFDETAKDLRASGLTLNEIEFQVAMLPNDVFRWQLNSPLNEQLAVVDTVGKIAASLNTFGVSEDNLDIERLNDLRDFLNGLESIDRARIWIRQRVLDRFVDAQETVLGGAEELQLAPDGSPAATVVNMHLEDLERKAARQWDSEDGAVEFAIASLKDAVFQDPSHTVRVDRLFKTLFGGAEESELARKSLMRSMVKQDSVALRELASQQHRLDLVKHPIMQDPARSCRRI